MSRNRIEQILVVAVVLGAGIPSSGCYSSHGDGDDDSGPGPGEYGAEDAWAAAETNYDVTCPAEMRCDLTECPDGMVLVPCGPFVMGADPDEWSFPG